MNEALHRTLESTPLHSNWVLAGNTVVVFTTVLAVFLLWFLLELRTARRDGKLVRSIHPYRRMVPFIMRQRNESVVYFDSQIRADKLLTFVEQAGSDIRLTHCIVAALGMTLKENPKMNRFVVGRRLYQRNESFVTFSMKRTKLDAQSKIAVVKLAIGPDDCFSDLVEKINERIGVERSDAKTHVDRELDFFLQFPRPILNLAVRFLQGLDYYNLLPASFIRSDGMYTSAFVANLGSLNMDAGYHHLYEWGNCPLFLMVGAVREEAVVEDGTVVVRKILPLRWSFDERIDDGLTARDGLQTVQRILEEPDTHLSSSTPVREDTPEHAEETGAIPG